MKLYHGSNVYVKEPIIKDSKRNLDFGMGFYTTSDLQQAIRWAKAVTKRREEGTPTVSFFELDEDLCGINVKKFEKSDGLWLDFVVEHRKTRAVIDDFDLIIGPVADDNTMPVISMYMNGDYNQEEAIKRLLTQKLTDQYVFKTSNALSKIKFLEYKEYE